MNSEIIIARATLGHITIRAELKLQSGTHIGGPQDTLDIGGIDNPIVRDPLTSEPYLPGSALKGKVRSMLEKDLIGLMDRDAQGRLLFTYNRTTPGGGGLTLYRHECDDAKDATRCPVCRLFGSSGKAPSNGPAATNFPAKVTVHDAFLTAQSTTHLQSLTTELPYAEWKAENTLDRVTAAAMPRQMERAARGAQFALTLEYRIENDGEALDPEVLTDLYNLVTVLSQLEEEGIGGSTSRGYGAVTLTPLQLCFTRKVHGQVGNGRVSRIQKIPVESLQLADAVDRLAWLVDREAMYVTYEEAFKPLYTIMETWVREALPDDTALLTPLTAIDQALETLCLEDDLDLAARKALLGTLAQGYHTLEQTTRESSYTRNQKQMLEDYLSRLQHILAPLIDPASYGDHFVVLQRLFAPNGAYQHELTRVYQRDGTPAAQDEAAPAVAADLQPHEESNHAHPPSVSGDAPPPGQG